MSGITSMTLDTVSELIVRYSITNNSRAYIRGTDASTMVAETIIDWLRFQIV